MAKQHSEIRSRREILAAANLLQANLNGFIVLLRRLSDTPSEIYCLETCPFSSAIFFQLGKNLLSKPLSLFNEIAKGGAHKKTENSRRGHNQYP